VRFGFARPRRFFWLIINALASLTDIFFFWINGTSSVSLNSLSSLPFLGVYESLTPSLITSGVGLGMFSTFVQAPIGSSNASVKAAAYEGICFCIAEQSVPSYSNTVFSVLHMLTRATLLNFMNS